MNSNRKLCLRSLSPRARTDSRRNSQDFWEGMKMQSGFWKAVVWAGALCSAAACVSAQQNAPLTAVPPKEGDFIAHDFKFSDGQTLPEVRLHYTTLGTPRRDSSGRVTNAVLILHGTNRAGHVWLVPSFAGVLFGPGQLLDASKYYLILPDQLGAGL